MLHCKVYNRILYLTEMKNAPQKLWNGSSS